MDRFVELRNVVKQFPGNGLILKEKGGTLAVDKVSCGINKNTIFSLVGESGCGKTTLARAVCYLDPPTGGEVVFDGTLLGSLSRRKLRDFRKRMQIVFQDPNSALNPKMSIGASLREGLVNRGLSGNVMENRENELLELVGISPSHKKRYPHEFSGGQKQRIVIARALTMEPDFLILDEPVSNLDVSIQAQIINLLLDLKDEFSLTYLFISHDLNLVSYLSDVIAVMYRGRIVEMADADEIMKHPLHPYTRELYSSVPGIKRSVMNSSERPVEDEGEEAEKAAEEYPGCPYYKNCPSGDSSCTREKPELLEAEEDHMVACYKVP